MIQSELPFDAVKLHKADGPSTSRVAAECARHLRARHHATILDVMAEGGDWTATDVAQRTGLNAVQVCRRFAELRVAELIYATGGTRPTDSGRPSKCYAIAEVAR